MYVYKLYLNSKFITLYFYNDGLRKRKIQSSWTCYTIISPICSQALHDFFYDQTVKFEIFLKKFVKNIFTE